MIDAVLRRQVERPLAAAARLLVRAGIGADVLTVSGFALGIAAIPALAYQHYWIGLALIVLNRLFDGLDGAVARQTQATDLGGYLDIVFDFIFYASVPLGFALARPEDALPAAFLICSFVATGTTFLAFASIAAKRGLIESTSAPRTIYYLGGLTEGAETILAFVLMCIFPEYFAWIAIGFGALCWITAGTRIAAAGRTFG